VVRGGDFFNDASYLRASDRDITLDPTYRDGGIGLRCSRTP
jgi:hypothetical protein